MTILYFILCGIHIVCFLVVLSTVFDAGSKELGFICLFLTLCTGLGAIVTFIVGWMNAKAWEIKPLMITWSIAWAAALGLVIKAQLL